MIPAWLFYVIFGWMVIDALCQPAEEPRPPEPIQIILPANGAEARP